MNSRILIVDDEAAIADAISFAFIQEGYKVKTLYDGEKVLDTIENFKPNILILDIMLPKLNGFDICKKIKNKNEIGIVMLTAKSDIFDKILGLELGADDYITKPFHMRELIARAKSLERRLKKESNDDSIIRCGDLKVSVDKRKVLVNDSELEFTPKEFDLLLLLVSNFERVYTREKLLELVWEFDYFGGTRTVDIHVQRIRKKLGDPYENIIQTVYKVGYKAVRLNNEA